MQSPETPSTASPKPKSIAPKGFTRCRAHNRSGSRCRLHAQDPATGLCFRHRISIGASDPLDDSLDLCPDLFRTEEGTLDSPEGINTLLTNVVILLGQGRISTRRAAVITYALSLLLRSVVAANRIAADTITPIIFDGPRPHDAAETEGATEHDTSTDRPDSVPEAEPTKKPS